MQPIDPVRDDLIGCPAAAKLLYERTGQRFHPTTIARWAREGKRSRSGQRVYLNAIHIGKQLYTRRDDIAQFIRAVNEQPLHEPTEDDEAEREAEQELDRAGIG